MSTIERKIQEALAFRAAMDAGLNPILEEVLPVHSDSSLLGMLNSIDTTGDPQLNAALQATKDNLSSVLLQLGSMTLKQSIEDMHADTAADEEGPSKKVLRIGPTAWKVVITDVYCGACDELTYSYEYKGSLHCARCTEEYSPYLGETTLTYRLTRPSL